MIGLGFRDPGFVGSLKIQATGGTVSEVLFNGTLYTTHTFTSGGNFTVLSGTAPGYVLVVAGGGSAGNGWSNPDGPRSGGGGGAGGWLLNGGEQADLSLVTPYTLVPSVYPITVGGAGQNSTAFGVTTTRGGNGGGGINGSGGSGGSGGGGSSDSGGGGAGTAGPPRQGFNGRNAAGGSFAGCGGGAGGLAPGGSNRAGGPGKAFLGTMYAEGGTTNGSTPSPLGSGGAARLNNSGLAGRPGVVVVAYRS